MTTTTSRRRLRHDDDIITTTTMTTSRWWWWWRRRRRDDDVKTTTSRRRRHDDDVTTTTTTTSTTTTITTTTSIIIIIIPRASSPLHHRLTDRQTDRQTDWLQLPVVNDSPVEVNKSTLSCNVSFYTIGELKNCFIGLHADTHTDTHRQLQWHRAVNLIDEALLSQVQCSYLKSKKVKVQEKSKKVVLCTCNGVKQLPCTFTCNEVSVCVGSCTFTSLHLCGFALQVIK